MLSERLLVCLEAGVDLLPIFENLRVDGGIWDTNTSQLSLQPMIDCISEHVSTQHDDGAPPSEPLAPPASVSPSLPNVPVVAVLCAGRVPPR